MTLFLYLSRRFMRSFLIVMMVVLCLIVAVDSMELIKKVGGYVISVHDLLTITVTKLPFLIQEVFVFLIFFSAVLTFFFFAKHGEYVAFQALGASVWQFLLPLIVLSVAMSMLLITLINPISTALLNYSEFLERRIMGKDTSNAISILGGEVWLFGKDKAKNESYIINAAKLTTDRPVTTLVSPNFIFLDKNYGMVRALQSEQATLENGNWVLKGYIEYLPKESPRAKAEVLRIQNNLDVGNLQKNFRSPRGVSIWSLPSFIGALESTGYPTQVYYIHMYKLLIKPLIMPAIIFFAAAFILKHNRLYKTGALLMACLVMFIVLYCIMELLLNVPFQNKILQALNFIFVVVSLNWAGVLLVKFSESK